MQLEASYDSQFENASYSSGTSWSAEYGGKRWDSSPDNVSLVSSQEEEKLYTVFYCIPLISPYRGILYTLYTV